MSYRKDPRKKLAAQLHAALSKGHRYAVIWIISERIQMTSFHREPLRVWSAWHPGTELIEIKEKLKALPSVGF